jgi:hypothetical protein
MREPVEEQGSGGIRRRCSNRGLESIGLGMTVATVALVAGDVPSAARVAPEASSPAPTPRAATVETCDTDVLTSHLIHGDRRVIEIETTLTGCVWQYFRSGGSPPGRADLGDPAGSRAVSFRRSKVVTVLDSHVQPVRAWHQDFADDWGTESAFDVIGEKVRIQRWDQGTSTWNRPLGQSDPQSQPEHFWFVYANEGERMTSGLQEGIVVIRKQGDWTF